MIIMENSEMSRGIPCGFLASRNIDYRMIIYIEYE